MERCGPFGREAAAAESTDESWAAASKNTSIINAEYSQLQSTELKNTGRDSEGGVTE